MKREMPVWVPPAAFIIFGAGFAGLMDVAASYKIEGHETLLQAFVPGQNAAESQAAVSVAIMLIPVALVAHYHGGGDRGGSGWGGGPIKPA